MDPDSTPAIHEAESQFDCPNCGSPRLRAIYGLPTSDLANDPTLKIMGCLVDEKMVEWFCPECNGSNMEGDDD